MTTSILSAISRVAEETIQRFEVPGIVIAFARGDTHPEHLVLGVDAIGLPLARDSLFPVASVTKLATALAVLRLIDGGKLALDEGLSRYLPEAAAAQSAITVRMLLSHTSGLPTDLAEERTLYRVGLNWSELAEACLNTPLERLSQTRVQYSNVGYGLLAILVERQTRLTFAAALRSLVLDPLGIEAYLGEEPPRPPVVLADVRSRHARTALEPYNSPFWRSLALPWAGLVTTADGALALVRAFQGIPREFLQSETRAEAVRNQAGDLGGGYGRPFEWRYAPWGLGPDLRDAKQPHWAPTEASPNCFGHAGASGAVAWADPDADVAWAILGTRTADNGWLVRGSPAIGAALLNAHRELHAGS